MLWTLRTRVGSKYCCSLTGSKTYCGRVAGAGQRGPGIDSQNTDPIVYWCRQWALELHTHRQSIVWREVWTAQDSHGRQWQSKCRRYRVCRGAVMDDFRMLNEETTVEWWGHLSVLYGLFISAELMRRQHSVSQSPSWWKWNLILYVR